MSWEQLMREFMRIGIAHEFRWVQEFAAAQASDLQKQNEITTNVLERRKKGEPLAYIFGSWPFCGLHLDVGPGVLIPRPETEELAVEVAKIVLNYDSIKNQPTTTIVDFGAGSGCLGLGLFVNLFEEGFGNNTELYLVEKSPTAISYLKKNVEVTKKHTQNFGQIHIVENDWALAELPKVIDVVVSNPPYIPEREYLELDVSVLEYEPKEALVPRANDLNAVACYQEIFKVIEKASTLSLPKIMAFEFGLNQDALLLDLFSKTISKSNAYRLGIKQDMCGKNRFLWAEMR